MKATKRLGLCFVGEHSCEEIVRLSKLAETAGYESVWAAEDLGFRDAIVPLAAVASATRQIKLATGILPVYYRTPALTAMTAATLDELSNQRLILGVGSGVRDYVERQGIEFKQPLTAVKEYVEIVRELLAGRAVSYYGTVQKLRKSKLSLIPPRARIPMYVAARKQLMFQLAGEIADGALGCDGFVAEGYVKWARENLRRGALKAHRDPESVDLAFLVLLSVSKDPDEAKEHVKPAIVSLFAEGVFDAHLKRMGVSESDVAPLRDSLRRGDLKLAYDNVPTNLLEASSIWGTPSQCATKMRRFREAGVDLPVVEPIGSQKERIIQLAKDW
jgi:5,10-methylenetetrahydromethanopterin reductase